MANLRDYGRFLRSGYTLRELGLNFFRLMVWSRLSSALKHSFHRRGRGVVVDHTACVQGSRFIELGEGTWIQRHAWLTVPLIEMRAPPSGPVLRFGCRVQVGPRCTFAAVNDIVVEDDALFAPNVFITDHIHAYADARRPIKDQGVASPGRVRIGKGAWVGVNAVVVANGKEVVIGEGAVVAANSVVTRSVPARCVVAGSPARQVDRYDEATGRWLSSAPADASQGLVNQ